MKTGNFLLLVISILVVSAGNAWSMKKKSEKKVTVTFEWMRIETHGSNQLAVWIEDPEGNHIKTIFATKFTATGGYVERPLSLSEWTAKFNIKNASKADIDAITGSTPQPGKQTLIWNCTDQSGKPVPKGKYIIRMEANILNANKMFFKGEIPVRGRKMQTSGEITYSSPELASGNVLFSNVLVEYK